MKTLSIAPGIQITGSLGARHDEVLTPAALSFLAELHRRFEPARQRLLRDRTRRHSALMAGALPEFPRETQGVREGTWSVATAPADLADRRVQLVGPPDDRSIAEGRRQGAPVYLADFEDATVPSWRNVLAGHLALTDASRARGLDAGTRAAALIVRPRGWHLCERHLLIKGEQASATLFDAGLFLFHNARVLLQGGTGPYLCLPKLEGYREARLWNEILDFAEEALNLGHGRARAAAGIETMTAAFEMEEILYELRRHALGLNAGGCSYLFSIAKRLRSRYDLVLPDRPHPISSADFLRSYAQLMVKTCHKRDAYATGGLTSSLPDRTGSDGDALGHLRTEKLRQARDGFDGTMVGAPEAVPVAMGAFSEFLGSWPHQLERTRDDVNVDAHQLLDFRLPEVVLTEVGLRQHVNVGLRYFHAWLRGTGTLAIDGRVEDSATAELLRAQVWQWMARGTRLADGRRVDRVLLNAILNEESRRLGGSVGPQNGAEMPWAPALALFDEVALGDQFVEFFTIPGYERLT